MKILLHSEAKTISNKELVENQEYLISMWHKLFQLIFKLHKKVIDINTKL